MTLSTADANQQYMGVARRRLSALDDLQKQVNAVRAEPALAVKHGASLDVAQRDITHGRETLQKELALRADLDKALSVSSVKPPETDPAVRSAMNALNDHRTSKRAKGLYNGGKVADPCQSCILKKIPEVRTMVYTVDEYVKRWEARTGRKMTAAERKTLERGCIGITALNLGKNGLPNPPLTDCYATLDQAKARAAQLEKDTGHAAVVFSKRFYSDGDSYTPDPYTGKVDMKGYAYKAKPGYVNFDYGIYEEETGSWWHANHKEPGMKVYRSTLQHYSRPLMDFDKQVFCVAQPDP